MITELFTHYSKVVSAYFSHKHTAPQAPIETPLSSNTKLAHVVLNKGDLETLKITILHYHHCAIEEGA